MAQSIVIDEIEVSDTGTIISLVAISSIEGVYFNIVRTEREEDLTPALEEFSKVIKLEMS